MSTRTRSNFTTQVAFGGGQIRVPSPKLYIGQPGIHLPSPVNRPPSANSGTIHTKRQQAASFISQSEVVRSGSPGFPVPTLPALSPSSGHSFSELSFSTPLKEYKNYQAWIQSAKAHTEEVKKFGSPYPLVWVLVEGKHIPPTALVGGEDHIGLLYIARSFFENGLYVGKAGRHLELGAAIPYNGREVPVSIYEVLVPAFNVFRYALSDTAITGQLAHMSLQTDIVQVRERYNELKVTLSLQDIRTYEHLGEFNAVLVMEEYEKNVEIKEFKSTIILDGGKVIDIPRDFAAYFQIQDTKSFHLESTFGAIVNIHSALRSSQFSATIIIDALYSLRQLSEVKTVILVDDSLSMDGQRWAEARDALVGVVDSVSQYGHDGIDLYFLNDERYGIGLTDGALIKELFDTVLPQGQTPTGQKLNEILKSTYLPVVEDVNANHKPIVIVTVTDGEPTDDLSEVIVEVATRLDQRGVPRRVMGKSGQSYRPLGLQFVQIGDDKHAAEFLRRLDDELSVEHGTRDLVDTVPFNSNDPVSFTSETLIKMLLGGIHPILDSVPSPIQSRSPLLRRPSGRSG